jgi:peptidoglycan/LPS O-acetylase OafA/YrhL
MLAIVLVVLSHAVSANNEEVSDMPWKGNFRDYAASSHPSSFFLSPASFGFSGVALFFLLSGFCIHLGYLRRTRPFSTLDFLKRRLLRIYPAYIFALTLFFILAKNRGSGEATPYQAWMHVLLLQDCTPATFNAINASFWSLSVEFQFYLLYPLFLAAVTRLSLETCFLGALGVNVAIYLAMSFRAHNFSYACIPWLMEMPYTWHLWILGACLAQYHVEGRRVFKYPWALGSLGLVAFFASLHYKVLFTESYFFIGVSFAVLIQEYVEWKRPLSKVEGILLPLGIISYSVYLLHQPLINPIFSWLHSYCNRPLSEVGTMILLFLVGGVSYLAFELGVPRVLTGGLYPYHLRFYKFAAK